MSGGCERFIGSVFAVKYGVNENIRLGRGKVVMLYGDINNEHALLEVEASPRITVQIPKRELGKIRYY